MINWQDPDYAAAGASCTLISLGAEGMLMIFFLSLLALFVFRMMCFIGHFYALVQSVSITCEDPSPPATDITSYVYNKNASAFTPVVAFSNQTTINGASSLFEMGGVWGVKGMVWGAVVVGLVGMFL